MKNIKGTEENLELFNENGIRVYEYFKNSNGYSYEYTRDSKGKVLTSKDSNGSWYECTYDSKGNESTYKDSNGYWYKCTYDSNGNELTYKNSNGETRGFDKTYTPEEVGYIKRAVHEYWEHWYAEHPENQNDLKLTQQILSK